MLSKTSGSADRGTDWFRVSLLLLTIAVTCSVQNRTNCNYLLLCVLRYTPLTVNVIQNHWLCWSWNWLIPRPLTLTNICCHVTTRALIISRESWNCMINPHCYSKTKTLKLMFMGLFSDWWSPLITSDHCWSRVVTPFHHTRPTPPQKPPHRTGYFERNNFILHQTTGIPAGPRFQRSSYCMTYAGDGGGLCCGVWPYDVWPYAW